MARWLLLVACLLLSVPRARAAAPLDLFESPAPSAEEQTFLARLRSELMLLGIEVRVRAVLSAASGAELEAGLRAAGRAAAALQRDANGLSLLFVPVGGGPSRVVRLASADEHDPSRWAAQAAEVLRPALLGDAALDALAPPSDGSEALPRPSPSDASAKGAQAADAELPPGLHTRSADARPMRPPARFAGELGVGLLSSPRAMPPQAAFSVSMGLRVSRWLRVELSVLAPLSKMVREVADTSLQARASLFGGGLQFAVYRQPRWDLSAALGAGPGLVAHRQSDAAWSRTLSVSLYGRVAGGIQLSHALSLRLGVSVGTLIDAVLLDSPGGPAWGGVWIGSTLGLLAGFD